jgi:hypothetical protein
MERIDDIPLGRKVALDQMSSRVIFLVGWAATVPQNVANVSITARNFFIPDNKLVICEL